MGEHRGSVGCNFALQRGTIQVNTAHIFNEKPKLRHSERMQPVEQQQSRLSNQQPPTKSVPFPFRGGNSHMSSNTWLLPTWNRTVFRAEYSKTFHFFFRFSLKKKNPSKTQKKKKKKKKK